MGFNNIIGHDKIIGRLKKALEKNEFASAYLFFGDESIGKRLTAIAFARAMNCLTAAADACGACISCQKIEKGIHPDVRIIAPEAEMAVAETNTESKGSEKKSKVIKIEQIRAIQNEMAYPPFEGKKRVFIIDNADRMNTEAANSLLKTLEEPARDSIIILVTSRPGYLPHTIISRCQGVRFAAPPTYAVKRLLMERGADENEASLIASITQGRIGAALNIDHNANKEKRGEYLHVFSIALHGSAGEIFSLSEKYAKEGEAVKELLDWLYLWLRDIIIFKETGIDSCLINSDRLEDIKECSYIDTIKCLDVIKSITDIQKAFVRNINKQLAMERIMMEIKKVGIG
ncbi:MAG: DNA polymerase III subunit delta' [Nitrospirae bacterium]|nr:DNA polymerase III subunit delta' [Nitrospirota bacterium]